MPRVNLRVYWTAMVEIYKCDIWLAAIVILFVFKNPYGGLVVFVSATDHITLCQSHDVSCLMMLEPPDVTAAPHL